MKTKAQQAEVKYDGGADMKIETEYEIGDPVCVMDCNQHDGYYITYRGFRWQDIPNVGKLVFGTYAEAKQAEERLNKEMFDTMSKRY